MGWGGKLREAITASLAVLPTVGAVTYVLLKGRRRKINLRTTLNPISKTIYPKTGSGLQDTDGACPFTEPTEADVRIQPVQSSRDQPGKVRAGLGERDERQRRGIRMYRRADFIRSGLAGPSGPTVRAGFDSDVRDSQGLVGP